VALEIMDLEVGDIPVTYQYAPKLHMALFLPEEIMTIDE
jgi:hypothetical protein